LTRIFSLFETLRKHSISRNFFALSLWQLTNYLIPLLTVPYLIRVIGTEKFGIVSFVQALEYYFIIIVDFGFGITAIKQISLVRNDPEKLSIVFNQTLFAKLFLCLVSFLVLALLVLLVPKFHSELPAYFLGFLLVIGQALFPVWFFQGVEEMKFITYFNLTAKVIFALAIFIFIRHESDYVLALPIQGLGVVIASLASLYLITRRFRLNVKFPGWANIFSALGSGLPILVSNFSVTTYNSSNYLILGFFADDKIVGLYSIVEKIALLVRQILSMLSQAVFPTVCLLAAESFGKLMEFWRNLIIPVAVLLFLFSCAIGYYSDFIISLIVGHTSAETAALLRIMIWVPFVVLFNIPFFQTLMAYDHKNDVMKVLMSCSAFSIILSVLLTYHFLAVGTIVSLLITEFVIILGLSWTLARRRRFLISN
jgi:polysaccharide transporter, PST family